MAPTFLWLYALHRGGALKGRMETLTWPWFKGSPKADLRTQAKDTDVNTSGGGPYNALIAPIDGMRGDNSINESSD